MRHGDEAAQVAEWLYGTLTGSQALADALGVPLAGLPARVWPEVAPSDAPEPLVVFSTSEALDRNAVGPHPRIMTTVPVNVRIVDRDQGPGTSSAAARVLYVLLTGNLNVPLSEGGTILTSQRSSVLNYAEDAGGIHYRHTGGLYDVEVN